MYKHKTIYEDIGHTECIYVERNQNLYLVYLGLIIRNY